MKIMREDTSQKPFVLQAQFFMMSFKGLYLREASIVQAYKHISQNFVKRSQMNNFFKIYIRK